MAYAAVASLLQTLECLLQFPCIILEIKIKQAKTFCSAIYPVKGLFEPTSKKSKARQEISLQEIEEEMEFLGSYEEEFPTFDTNPFTVALLEFLGSSEKEFPTFENNPFKVAFLEFLRSSKKEFCAEYDIDQFEISVFKTDFGQFCLRRLEEKIEPLSLPVAEYVETVTFDGQVFPEILEITERICGIYHGTPVMSEKMFEILEQVSQISVELEFIAEPLKTFLDEVNSSQSSWEVVLGILLDSQSLMQEITFFHEVIVQTMVFCENLRFFLSFFEDFSGKFCDSQVVRSRKNVVDRAGNFVEDCMMDYPIESEMNYLDVVTKSGTYISGKEINLEKLVKDIFDGEKGIRQYLFQASEEIHHLKREIRKIHDKPRSLPAASTSLPKGSSLRNSKQNIVVGLDDEMIRIMEGLTRLPSGLEIVTIVGMGGIGKTTLARQIFHHPFIDYHFPCRAWVIVSQVYNVRNLLLGLFSSVAPLTDEVFEKNNAQLAEKLYRSLQGTRYLIVMDDMWSISAWNDVKRCFPDEKIGSRI